MVEWGKAAGYLVAIGLPVALTYLAFPTKETTINRDRYLLSSLVVGLVTAAIASKA